MHQLERGQAKALYERSCDLPQHHEHCGGSPRRWMGETIATGYGLNHSTAAQHTTREMATNTTSDVERGELRGLKFNAISAVGKMCLCVLLNLLVL